MIGRPWRDLWTVFWKSPPCVPKNVRIKSCLNRKHTQKVEETKEKDPKPFDFESLLVEISGIEPLTS